MTQDSRLTPEPGEISEDAEGLEIYICARVSTYREYAKTLPRPDDVVIELGCAEGHTTCALARRSAKVVAVEKTAQSMDRAKARCPNQDNIVWLEADAHDLDLVRERAPRADLIFIDIGGSTRQWRVTRIAGMYRKMFRPRAMVLRNVQLNDFIAAIRGCERDARPGHWREPSPD